MAEYDLEPVDVPRVETRHRRIVTALPVPESLDIFRTLTGTEPRSMRGQPPIVWDSAEGSAVRDAYGNQWIDWSSGVLITNAGHGHPAIRKATLRRLPISIETSLKPWPVECRERSLHPKCLTIRRCMRDCVA